MLIIEGDSMNLYSNYSASRSSLYNCHQHILNSSNILNHHCDLYFETLNKKTKGWWEIKCTVLWSLHIIIRSQEFRWKTCLSGRKDQRFSVAREPGNRRLSFINLFRKAVVCACGGAGLVASMSAFHYFWKSLLFWKWLNKLLCVNSEILNAQQMGKLVMVQIYGNLEKVETCDW